MDGPGRLLRSNGGDTGALLSFRAAGRRHRGTSTSKESALQYSGLHRILLMGSIVFIVETKPEGDTNAYYHY
jgi:hypothetical protein